MKVSNPDKLMFPDEGITKAEVVAYYQQVGEVMVPHLEGRPLTLQRFPDGIDHDGFMQKNASKHFPDSIERVEVPREGGTTTHPLVDSIEDLIYLANQGTITFHIWTSRLPTLDRPDRLVLDVDPSEASGPPRQAALHARGVMADMGLESGLMTTGSRGYHVVAPIVPEHDFETVGKCARLLAEIVTMRHPDTTTTEFRKRNRGHRVFIDWLRNRWAQSVVASWSLRPRPRAPVAMPITWEELDDTDPDRWTIGNATDRILMAPQLPEPSRLDPDRVNTLAAELRPPSGTSG